MSVRFHKSHKTLAATAVAVAAILALGACSGSKKARSSSAPATSGSIASATTTAQGVQVTGGFGTKPSLVVPTSAAPAALTQQTITQGAGAAIVAKDTVIVNYVGQTWAQKNGAPNVFDSSFTRGTPAAFVIGANAVIPGWDKTLVGKQVGSRVVLTIPPADGYGATGQSSANIGPTDTLVFVIDLVADYKPDASAPGTIEPNLPATGLPKFTNVPGQKPVISSTTGVKVPAQPTSTLVVLGSGAKIDSAKTLLLQIVQTDIATGKTSQATWGVGPQAVPASSVLGLADKLTGKTIGSRAVVLTPPHAATPATATAAARSAIPAEILIVDVIGQF
ncbi:MAG: FKBP-type peptidyl-prolyl cis-trans isomerase [Actinomycetota bacterium]|nr:FKBP-type peptidyl-prolyl cis-trans isomerase [Actinomycetota bacterium]